MKLRFFLLFIFTVCLSLFHVHYSINTVSNPANPMSLILMLVYSMRLEDNFITYYIVQSLVTIIIAQFVLNWRKMYRWLFLCIIVCFVATYLNVDIEVFYNWLQQHPLHEIYYSYYGYKQALATGVICVILQSLLLFSYLFLTLLESSIIYKKMRLHLKRNWELCIDNPTVKKYKKQIFFTLFLLILFLIMSSTF